MNYDEYVEQLKKFALKKAVSQTFKIIVAKLPFLLWGPFGPLLKMALTKIMTIAINETEMGLFFKYTDVRVDKQGRDFHDAIEVQFRVLNSGTKEEKKNAEKNLEESFRNLVKLTN